MKTKKTKEKNEGNCLFWGSEQQKTEKNEREKENKKAQEK